MTHLQPIVTWQDDTDVVTAGLSWVRIVTGDGQRHRFNGTAKAHDLVHGLALARQRHLEHNIATVVTPLGLKIDAGPTHSDIDMPDGPIFNLENGIIDDLISWFDPGAPVEGHANGENSRLELVPGMLMAGRHAIDIEDPDEFAAILFRAAAASNDECSLPLRDGKLLCSLLRTRFILTATSKAGITIAIRLSIGNTAKLAIALHRASGSWRPAPAP